jgi:hypothetical protein
MSAKWLELLKEIAPGVTRAAVIREGTNPAGIGQFAAIQSVAPSNGVQVSPVVVRDSSEIGASGGSPWHFERDPIPYALETDWPVGAAGFEPLHIRIGICQDSQPGGRDSKLELAHPEFRARPIDA